MHERGGTMKFIHLSDLHIHSNDNDNRGVSELLEFIERHYPEHRLIVTGDITDDGAPRQYENAYKLLKPFMGRIFICPGNHDFGAVGSLFSRERAIRFDEHLAKPLNQGGTFQSDTTPVVNVIKDGETSIILIALDSNLETQHAFDFACGEIGGPQLRALETILATAPNNAVKLLFFHHHPFMVNDPFMELKDAQMLARTIYGRTDVILFGHKHEMKQWENRWGAKYILAADNSSDKKFAKEITVEGTFITVSPVAIRRSTENFA
jgi:3',5'-cyclic AMP phosphodiesterase CpdA